MAERLGRVGVVRAISRLVGGSAIQAITLTRTLSPFGYDTTLVAGEAAAGEGTMDHLARDLDVPVTRLPGLQRSLGPHDARAVAAMRKVIRAARPGVLHTHAAKGGTVGRIAAMTAGSDRPPVTVHTFHGHVLRGYFGERETEAYRRLEAWLARRTTVIVAVAPQVKADLVELGVAPAGRIEVIPLGFDLEPFQAPEADRAASRSAFRERLGIPPDARVVTIVARMVPIKRVDRFLRVAREVAGRHPDAVFAVVGDGELTAELRASDDAAALGEGLVWAGYTEDVAEACFGSDVVALTSANEGTPVSLIEAHAAGLPAVSTDVGGVRQVVADGESGYVVAEGDEAGFAEAVSSLVSDPDLAARMGERGRERVTGLYSLDRLTSDMDRLYADLLRHKGVAAPV